MAEVLLGHGTTRPPRPLDITIGGEQDCVVTVDKKGFYIDAGETRRLPRWRASFQWRFIQRLVVEATPEGAAITVQDRSPEARRVELRDASVAAIEQALAPFRPYLGTAPPRPSAEERKERLREPLDEVLFEAREGGLEVFLSDEIGHDREDDVVEFVAWLQTYRGVDQAVHEDRERIIVLGDFSHRSLKRDAKQWWRRRVPGLRLK